MKKRILLPSLLLLAAVILMQVTNGTSATIQDQFTIDQDEYTGPAYPGQPAPGKFFWGSSIHGNGDPVTRHEIPSGETLAIRRTFWTWDQRVGKMITSATDDIENGRLPWISIKPPNSGENRWKRIGDGEFDEGLDEMLLAMDAMGGPVWFTMHHEPENDNQTIFGGAADHVAMNRRIRERMNILETENIALAPVYMAWTFQAPSGRDPNEWWDEDIYDFMGIDIYRDNEGSMLTVGNAIGGGPVWPYIRSWAEDKNTDVAVGEWGMRGTDDAAGQRMLEWYEAAANSYKTSGARVVGLSAFDSGLNSDTGSWELKGAQLEMYHELLGDPRTASIYTYSEIIVGVEDNQTDLPNKATLHQNYPNPFNPSTEISYQLSENSKVILEVFNVLGQQVKVLVNQNQAAGLHTVTFETGALPSGIYFYRLQAGDYIQTRQMMLVK
ncbi:MAG: T9SS type A sorting domain-containing protein [Balneolales bacterium]